MAMGLDQLDRQGDVVAGHDHLAAGFGSSMRAGDVGGAEVELRAVAC